MANETKVYVGKKGAQTLYKRLKDLIGRITTYQKVTNTTEAGVPIVTNPNSRTIYLVKDNTVVGDDKYKEWIWTSDLGWECIGTTSIPENAWKQWAEDNGSVGTTDTVYLGKDNNLARTWSFGFGNNNTSSTTLENVDWSGSDVVMIGSFNNAIDAAGAYQVGFRNSVVNNHRMSESSQYYNYYTAINFGNGNEIDAEGMNLGKDNTAADFGMNIGQHNSANHASLSIGERVSTDQASISIGTDSVAENKSLSIGFGSVIAGVLYDDGEILHSAEYGSSLAIGINHLCAAKNSIAIGSGVTTADTYSMVSGGSFAILAEGIQLAQQASSIYGNSFGVGSCLTLKSSSFSIGRFNTADNYSYAIGERNTVNCGSFAIGQNNTLIGDPNGANYAWGDAFATGRDLNDVRGRSCTFGIGNAHITQFAYSAGISNNTIHESAVAVGIENNNVYSHSTAVGSQNSSIYGDGVAIGNGNRDIRSMGTAVGCYNYSVYGGSFATGLANTAQNGSIAIGISNYARNGGMLFGIANKAIAYSTDSYYVSYHANSVVMGFGNEVYNVRDTLNKSGWTKAITTCGMAIGAYIKAYGHNFISIGSSNTLGDVDNWMNDTAANTDNDGFMTAIGFQCTAKRNYDFAYGYQSTASGGENIAFQHSSATGYRNIAMVDSAAIGTGNIAIMESTLGIAMASGYDATKNLTHNTLLNARLLSTQACSSNYGYHHNILASVSAFLYAPSGAAGNVIIGGRNRSDYTLDYNPSTLTTVGGAITGNFVLGNMTAGATISAQNGVRNNLIVNPEQMSITSLNAVAVNTMINSTVALDKSEIVMYNFVHCSKVLGTVGPFTNNVLFGNSRIESTVYDNSNGLFKNVLFSNSSLKFTDKARAWSSNQPTGENFLVGTMAENTLACVSFGDRSPDYETYASPMLTDCLRVFNFGDNTIKRAMQSAIFGTENQLTTARRVFISGDENMLYGQTNASLNAGAGNISSVNIFGCKNKFYSTSTTSVERSMMRGDGNEVYTGCHDLTTFGNYNQVGIGTEPTYTDITTISAFNQVINGATLVRVHTPTPMPLPGIYETKTSGTTYYKGWYVLYANGLLYNTWSTPASYTSITGANLIAGYLAGTLTDNAWYNLSENYTLTSGQTVYTGELTESGYYYILGKGNAYKDSSTYWNDRDFITGDYNRIYCGINDSVIFGNDNLISRSVGNYSHDFIQGNNNTITDGSGSVIIGSGSTATGHMAIAIGNQLKANQWQTVIGKYNSPIDGPGRLADPTTESTKALFIVGNGYSESEGRDWMSEGLIHRSNAMVVYADGTVKAKKFVSDEPELELTAGNGINITKSVNAGTITISANGALPAPPANEGTYALQCVVDANGVATYSWAAIGTSN